MKSKSDCCHCQQAASTRRDFLRVGTLSFLGIGLSDFLRADKAQPLAAVGGSGGPT